MRDKRPPTTRAATAVRDVHIDEVGQARGARGDIGAVSKFGFLAGNMPSVLKRLHPMHTSSAGMLSYLFGPTPRRRES